MKTQLDKATPSNRYKYEQEVKNNRCLTKLNSITDGSGNKGRCGTGTDLQPSRFVDPNTCMECIKSKNLIANGLCSEPFIKEYCEVPKVVDPEYCKQTPIGACRTGCHIPESEEDNNMCACNAIDTDTDCTEEMNPQNRNPKASPTSSQGKQYIQDYKDNKCLRALKLTKNGYGEHGNCGPSIALPDGTKIDPNNCMRCINDNAGMAGSNTELDDCSDDLKNEYCGLD